MNPELIKAIQEATRIAKIEVLNELYNRLDKYGANFNDINTIIDELKSEIE